MELTTASPSRPSVWFRSFRKCLAHHDKTDGYNFSDCLAVLKLYSTPLT